MTTHDFTTAFSVDKSPDEVFRAINNVRGWWSEEIDGATDTPGAEFTYHYGDVHRCRIKITEFVPGRKVVWLVVDNYFDFTTDATEWKGTKVVFEISRSQNKTRLRFTHEGLVPEYECFDVCSNAWGSYINGSLRSLIETGKGRPNQKEQPPSPSRT
jgi:Activator of Hsp90 ATPase homolog 1-like protein